MRVPHPRWPEETLICVKVKAAGMLPEERFSGFRGYSCVPFAISNHVPAANRGSHDGQRLPVRFMRGGAFCIINSPSANSFNSRRGSGHALLWHRHKRWRSWQSASKGPHEAYEVEFLFVRFPAGGRAVCGRVGGFPAKVGEVAKDRNGNQRYLRVESLIGQLDVIGGTAVSAWRVCSLHPAGSPLMSFINIGHCGEGSAMHHRE
ncbi:sugar transport protein [Anopheles sinensis]|uniref:Sugar transport protein n=1 Tax=Anopheles sinensis TaxID=74873 RepID=A0A084VTC8_ANOSI|nr:sugar transport protein [Anopheles sinensis]